MSKINLPITGICSFAKYPIANDINDLDADIAVLGAPYDLSVGARSGCRMGPRGIRDVSVFYSKGDAGFYDPEREDIFLAAPFNKIVDCGDADIVTGLIEDSFDAIEESVRAIVKQNVIPFVMGGDHAITVPIMRAMDSLGPLTVVQFDAHLDWTNGPGKQMYSNGCPMRRISEMPHVKNMIQIGLRGFGTCKKADFEDAKAWGSKLITAKKALELGPEGVMACVPDGERYYVSVDIDGFDITHAPGVGNPSPGGMNFRQVTDMLEILSRKGEIVGFDIVETAPQYDPSGVTVRIAAQVMVYCMAFIYKAKELKQAKQVS